MCLFLSTSFGFILRRLWGLLCSILFLLSVLFGFRRFILVLAAPGLLTLAFLLLQLFELVTA